MSARINSGQLSFSLEPDRRIFTVGELNAAVQGLFEQSFNNIWVAGEISGCKAAPSGHYYLVLKDGRSQVRCVLFKTAARLLRFKIMDGLAVIVRGRLEVYEARGEYQLIVESMELQGAGALQLAFEQMKKRLALEGLFEQARKKPLPKFPKRIGIVTSPSGAVIRDILHVLERRFPGLHIRLFPALVQGEGSTEQVCAGLRYFMSGGWAEVILLARGGGSLEDLWTFNEEAVARTIAASAVPVISAIGHETDFTIADFVADQRAPTPSAAAEIVICTRQSLLEQIEGLSAQAIRNMRYRAMHQRHKLEQQGAARAGAVIQRGIMRRAQMIDDWEAQLRWSCGQLTQQKRRRLDEAHRRLQSADLRLKLARRRHALDLVRQRLSKTMEAIVQRSGRRLNDCALHLRQLSPLTVLGRGYAIVEDEQRHVLTSSSETGSGARLHIRLHSGRLEAEVKSVS